MDGGIQPKAALDSELRARKIERLEGFKFFMDNLNAAGDVEKLKFVFDEIHGELEEKFAGGKDWISKTDFDSSPFISLKKRRSEIEIIVLMLKTAINGADKTEIFSEANLSHAQLKNYLGFLIQAALIEETKKSKRHLMYTTTKKGSNLLFHWSRILLLLKNASKSNKNI
jgi:predicted transcriptional regulator